MTAYRYLSTDVVTGRLLADELPLHVQGFARQLGQATDLTGYMDLNKNNAIHLSSGALEPQRTMLWALEDGWPVWVGVLWDAAATSVLGNQLPIKASTLESLLARRQIRDPLMFANADYADVWRALLAYATDPAAKGPGAPVAGLSAQQGAVGTALTTSYAPGDLKDIATALADLETAGDFEATFDPVLDGSGQLAILARIAPQLGQPYQQIGGVQLVFPGNLADYGWPRMGSQGSNSVIATAPANLSAAGTWTSSIGNGHGVDAARIAAGYPLLESAAQYSGAAVTSQAQIDAYADGHLGMLAGSPTIPPAVIDMSSPSSPRVKQLGLGDAAALLARSSLHPARADGSPGLAQIVRIIGWSVAPPDQGQDGKVTLTLGGVAG